MSDIVNEEIGSYYNKVDPHFAELGRRLQKVAKTMKDEERANMVAITGTELQNYEGDFNKLLKNLEAVGVGQEQLKVWLEKAEKLPATDGSDLPDPEPDPEDDVEESGLQRYTGIKKYGKKGFEALQKAGREGASEEEKGAIKDRYLKKK